jgi:hypothetical protein|tara:strand:+ start:226 stop:417 length:192 start_codon:yes stop_codon:yes gene_type:complete
MRAELMQTAIVQAGEKRELDVQFLFFRNIIKFTTSHNIFHIQHKPASSKKVDRNRTEIREINN